MDIKIAQKGLHTRPHAPPEGSARVEARGTGSWVVDRVSIDRVGSKSGSALIGSGQNPGRGVDRAGSKSGSAVDRVGSKSGLGSDRVRDDVSMTSASGNLNRFDRVENGSGQNRFDRVGHVTGSS